MAFKLNYKITGRTQSEGVYVHDVVHVEWTHADGPIPTFKTVPVTHPPDIKYEEVLDEPLTVVHDSINVPIGTPDSVVMQICEEKRERLAANLRVEP